MSKPLLLDTDVLVDFLRGNEKAVAFVKEGSDRILLSAIVIAELHAGAKGDQEQKDLDDLVSLYRVVPVTAEIARRAGVHSREYRASHGVGLGDAILAATAESEGAGLQTLNVKHYPMMPGLKAPYAKLK